MPRLNTDSPASWRSQEILTPAASSDFRCGRDHFRADAVAGNERVEFLAVGGCLEIHGESPWVW